MPFICAQSTEGLGPVGNLLGQPILHRQHLPFGLHYSPVLFHQVADTFQWILVNECHINRVLHYLADFLFVEPDTPLAVHP